MPIQIIDNFDLNSGKPIDNRFVVGSQSFYTTKDSITYKYPGMRVWDLNDDIPYVWTGTTFSSENSVSISGNGTANYLSKYLTTNIIGNSLIYDNGTNVGIATISPAYRLDINGDVRSQGTNGFYGVGSNLTALTATNITLGSLSLARITNGTTGQLLVAGASQPQWTNASLITVGTASAVTITDDTSTAATHYPLFSSSSSGSAIVKTSSTKLEFNPSTGVLTTNSLTIGSSTNKATIQYSTNAARTLSIPSVSGNRTFAFINQLQNWSETQIFTDQVRLSSGTNALPSLAFSSSSSTGIYRSATSNIDFSINGSRSINFWRNSPNATEIRFFNASTQMGALVSWHASNYLTIDWDFVHVGHTTTALGANCYITNEGDGTGRIYRSTSSIKYKKEVETLQVDLGIYKKIRPVTYKSKIEEDDDRKFIGYIAEEIDEIGYTELVQYDKGGDPDGLSYSNFTSLNTAVIQILLKRIEDLESKLN